MGFTYHLSFSFFTLAGSSLHYFQQSSNVSLVFSLKVFICFLSGVCFQKKASIDSCPYKVFESSTNQKMARGDVIFSVGFDKFMGVLLFFEL